MTYLEFVQRVSTRHKMDAEVVRKVLDAASKEVIKTVAEDGDEVKILGLGCFYSASYTVREGPCEFGGVATGGQRRRIRFRPFDSTTHLVNAIWKQAQKLV